MSGSIMAVFSLFSLFWSVSTLGGIRRAGKVTLFGALFLIPSWSPVVKAAGQQGVESAGNVVIEEVVETPGIEYHEAKTDESSAALVVMACGYIVIGVLTLMNGLFFIRTRRRFRRVSFPKQGADDRERFFNSFMSTTSKSKTVIEILSRLNDVLYVKADGNYSILGTHQGESNLDISLKEILAFFPNTALLRIHRSWAVNPTKITEIKRHGKAVYVVLGTYRLRVGKTYVAEIKMTFDQLIKNSQSPDLDKE